jgi:hypothetical protein
MIREESAALRFTPGSAIDAMHRRRPVAHARGGKNSRTRKKSMLIAPAARGCSARRDRLGPQFFADTPPAALRPVGEPVEGGPLPGQPSGSKQTVWTSSTPKRRVISGSKRVVQSVILDSLCSCSALGWSKGGALHPGVCSAPPPLPYRRWSGAGWKQSGLLHLAPPFALHLVRWSRVIKIRPAPASWP